jgi:chromosome segregation ATPase
LNDAIAAVAEARAKLAERQHGGGAASGAAGDTLEALSRERVNLSVDLHELEARLEFVEKRLPPLRLAMDKLDALQRAEGDLNSAREALAQSTNSYRDMSRRLETADPPQVLVKSMADSEKPLAP